MSVSHCLPRGVIKLDSIEKRQVQFLFKYYFMFVHLCTRYILITYKSVGLSFNLEYTVIDLTRKEKN